MSFPRPIALTLVLPALVFGAEKAARAPETVSAPVASTSSGYELRGFFGAGENIEVSVRRVGTEKSEWLRVGQKSGDLLIEKADLKAGTATLVTGDRRIALRLAGEAPSAPLKPVPVPVVEEKKSSKAEARAARRAQLEAMRENMTPAQMEVFGKVMEAKMKEFQKTDLELGGVESRTRSAWGTEDAEARQKIAQRLVPAIHEAAEEAFKLPGKDGKITPLPANFRTMMTDEMNEAHGEPDAPPAKPTPPSER